jgi:hypothetical protein
MPSIGYVHAVTRTQQAGLLMLAAALAAFVVARLFFR